MTTFHLRTAGRLVRIAQSTDKEVLFDDIGKDYPAKDLNAKSIQSFLGRGLKDIVFKVNGYKNSVATVGNRIKFYRQKAKRFKYTSIF